MEGLSDLVNLIGEQNNLSGLQQYAAQGGAANDPDFSKLAQLAPRAYEQIAPILIQRQIQMNTLGLNGGSAASAQQAPSALQQYGSQGDQDPNAQVPQSLPGMGTGTGQPQAMSAPQPSALDQVRQAFAFGNGNLEAGFKAMQAQRSLAVPPGMGAIPQGQQLVNGQLQTVPGAMTEGQKDRDKDFADVYTPFKNTGGMQTQQTQIQAIQGVIDRLNNKTINTGPGSLAPLAFDDEGNASWTGRLADNDLLQANNQIMKAVLPSAKALFGPRVTQKEVAMNLMANGLNPYGTNDQNVDNLTTLMGNLKNANQQIASAGSYFDQHGTLAGYTGTIPGVDPGATPLHPEGATGNANPELIAALKKRGLVKQ